jgi:lipase maturation factor 1
VPFAIFGPRRVRLAAAAILTGFQLVNIATANYGFFAYLAIVLHVFLLDDRDLIRVWTRIKTLLRRKNAPAKPLEDALVPRWRFQLRVAVAVVVSFFFVAISTVDGLINFTRSDALAAVLLPLRDHYYPWRVINSYHLFGQITVHRIEPEFETSDDGEHWSEHRLWHKPGDLARRPDWVAPHQPRVDFQLWFYGLRPSAAPGYVETLVERLCRDPQAVQTLFRDRLPAAPRAVRIAFWQYHFTTVEERRATGDWWTRTLAGTTAPIDCKTANFPDPSDD